MKRIYLDYASATPVDSRVLNTMLPYYTEKFANPSSLHGAGRKVREEVEKARNTIGKILNCSPEQIIFTSGGTESINLAMKGVARKGSHIITTKIEHPAVLETCRFLETQGVKVTYLPVDRYGMVNPQDVEHAITRNTILISIMYANNEIGTIQPIQTIGILARKRNILFHTDACQAGLLELDVRKLPVDLLTLNGSKMYGPKGIGLLYAGKGVLLHPLLHGGNQESGLRSGTEHVPGIMGLAAALELLQKNRLRERERLSRLSALLWSELQKIPQATLNGHPTKRLPGILNVSFASVEAESLMNYLSQQNISVSTGSACSSRKIEASHVLKALGKGKDLGSIRFSLGKFTTRQDVLKTAQKVKQIVTILRLV